MAEGGSGPATGSSSMGVSDKGLDDDYVKRVREKCRAPFCERVIPNHLMIYLTCLEPIDEEHVRAQQTQNGDILAASILFDKLVKKPNGFPDLVKALKNPGIGLEDLADEFESVEKTVSVIWDMVGFTGPNGEKECFDGHACETDITVPKVVVSLPSGSQPDMETPVDLKRKREEQDLKEKKVKLEEKENQNKANKVRLEIMEILVKDFKDTKDFPTLMSRMKQVNLELVGVEKGSILFNIHVRSLGDLDRLESLWRYGGLKKMLDKEMMSSDKLQAIQEVCTRMDYQVTDVISRVHIHQTDIERCRAWLQQQQTVSPLPTDTSSGLTMSDSDKNFRRTAKYVRDRLPRYFRTMTEDPFLMERMHKFYSLVDSREQQQKNKAETSTEKKASTSTDSEPAEGMSVAELFWNWFEKEMSSYLKALTTETFTKIVQMSCISFLMIESHQKSHVPHRLQTFPLASSLLNAKVSDTDVTLKHPTLDEEKIQDPLSISSLLEVPLQELPGIRFKEVEPICTYLCEKGVMSSTKYGSSFVSDLVLGVFVANLLSKCPKYPVSFDGPLLEMFRQFLPFCFILVAWNRSCDPECLFNDHNVLSLCVNKREEHALTQKPSPALLIWREKSDLYPKDVANSYSSNCKVEVADSTVQAAKSLKRNRSITLRPSKAIFVDLSHKTFDNVDKYLTDVLRWLNLIDCINFDTLSEICKTYHIDINEMFNTETSFDNTMDEEPATKKMKHTRMVMEKFDEAKLVSMSFSGQKLNREAFEALTEFMSVASTVSTLHLRNCHIQDTRNFMSGHFENLAYLDISENTDPGLQLQDSLGFQFLPNLECLEMQCCDLGDTGVTKVANELRHLTKLRELNLANNSLSAKGLIELSTYLESNHKLASLRLNKNPIGEDGALILAAWLRRLLLLEVLNIGECKIANGLDHITESLVSKSLRKLSVRCNEFDPADIDKFLNNFTRPPHLNHLDFSGNAVCEQLHRYIPEDTAKAFVRFLTTGNETWSYISMWKCGLGSVRIFKDVEKFACLENLTYFCLQENEISDNFAEDVASCIKKHCCHLQHLNLRDNQIGDSGCVALAQAIESQAFLKEIFLDRNSIDVRGVRAMAEAFQKMQVIQEMDLSFNDMQRHEMELLESSLKINTNALDIGVKEDDTMGPFVLRRVEDS